MPFVFGANQSFAQSSVPVPPPMVPEMTEFWEPEVKVVTPGKAAPDAIITAPSDAIVLVRWQRPV